MADNKTAWVALLPKFTTVVGAHTYYTDAVGVAKAYEFEGEVYRSEIDADASVTVSLEESNDGEQWDVVFTGDPGDDARQPVSATITKSLLRVKVALSTTGSVIPAVTLWLVGMLMLRR